MKGARLILLNSVSSFFACASAGYLNAWFMRKTEMQKGIHVIHPESGENIGLSKNCAARAVQQTAMSRIFLNITIFLPPLGLMAIEGVHLMPGNFYLKTLVEGTLIAGELYLAVPTGIAMFPQIGTIKAADLEEEFQVIKSSSGDLIKEFKFNKGL